MTKKPNKIKIGHTSDWHVGKSYLGAKQETKQAVYEAINRLIKQVIKEELDILMISGDIFEYYRPYPEDFVFVKQMFEKLKSELPEINIIAIRGNHDSRVDPKFNILYGLNTQITYIEDEVKVLKIRGQTVKLYGIGHKREDLREIIENLINQEAPTPDDLNILMLHQTVTGLDKSEDRYYVTSYGKTVSKALLSGYGFDYVALGHHHKTEIVKQNETTIAYCGAIEHWDIINWEEEGKITSSKNWILLEYENNELNYEVIKFVVMTKIRNTFDLSDEGPENVVNNVETILRDANSKFKGGIINYNFIIPFQRADLGYPFVDYRTWINDLLIDSCVIQFQEPEGEVAELVTASEEDLLEVYLKSRYQDSSDFWFDKISKLIQIGKENDGDRYELFEKQLKEFFT